jgi:hypothetical protein
MRDELLTIHLHAHIIWWAAIKRKKSSYACRLGSMLLSEKDSNEYLSSLSTTAHKAVGLDISPALALVGWEGRRLWPPRNTLLDMGCAKQSASGKPSIETQYNERIKDALKYVAAS